MARGRKAILRAKKQVTRKAAEARREEQRKSLLSYRTPLTPEEIANYKEEMSKVVEHTNFRIDALLAEHQMTTQLHAFLQGDYNKRFDISDINDVSRLREYMTEVRTVLSSIEEGNKKAEIDTAILSSQQFKGQFGNKWGRRFNVNDVIDESGNIIKKGIRPEVASKAFEAYRKLEEEFAGYIGRQGQELMYGSENLITMLYDFYDRGMDGQSAMHEALQTWIDDQLLELGGINFSISQATAMIINWDDYLRRRDF